MKPILFHPIPLVRHVQSHSIPRPSDAFRIFQKLLTFLEESSEELEAERRHLFLMR